MDMYYSYIIDIVLNYVKNLEYTNYGIELNIWIDQMNIQ